MIRFPIKVVLILKREERLLRRGHFQTLLLIAYRVVDLGQHALQVVPLGAAAAIAH